MNNEQFQAHRRACQLKLSHLLDCPEILRLCTDFDLCVQEASPSEENEFSLSYALLTGPYQQQQQAVLTPYFSSLSELEAHIKQASTHILNRYLYEVTFIETADFESKNLEANSVKAPLVEPEVLA